MKQTKIMKLIVVMSLDAYRDDLHGIYRDHEIRVFSEIDIDGYHHHQTAAATAVGWFAHAETPAYSTLTWAFLRKEQADELLDAIEAYNGERNLDHPVRAFELPVDRSV